MRRLNRLRGIATFGGMGLFLLALLGVDQAMLHFGQPGKLAVFVSGLCWGVVIGDKIHPYLTRLGEAYKARQPQRS